MKLDKARNIDQQQREIQDLRVCLDIREREIRKKEKKIDRDLDRLIKTERESSINQSKLGSEQALRKMITRVNSLQKEDKDGENENRVKQIQRGSNSVTNMQAYINKCSCNSSLQDSGIFNCDLHRSMNKS